MFFCYTVEMKIEVPYQSQYHNIVNPARAAGACGMACMTMLAGYFTGTKPMLGLLDNEGRVGGGYTATGGWQHDYIIKLAPTYGFTLEKIELNVDYIWEEIVKHCDAGEPMIASVYRKIFDRKLYHMIVIVGYEIDGPTRKVIYHDPADTSETGGANLITEIAYFIPYSRGMFFIARKNA